MSDPNWKEEAKEHFKNANIVKCLQVMADNGIIVDRFLSEYRKYTKKQSDIKSENRTYTDAEHKEQQELFETLIRRIMNVINTK